MNLSEYLPVLNNSLQLYINANGLITTDTHHHANIFKFTIIHYWHRFSKVIDNKQLWFILKAFNGEDRFQFNADGTPFMPPASIVYLKQKEQERNLLEGIFKIQNKKTINVNFAFTGFILFLCCTISILYYMVHLKLSTKVVFSKKIKDNKFAKLYHSLVTSQN